MSKTARQGASGYRPSGRQCAECQHAAEDCSRLDFAAMPPAGKRDADGVQRVACRCYVRADEHPCCGALANGPHKMGCYNRLNAAPTDHCEDILHMVPCAVCAAGHATLQRDDAGYYRACEACGSDYAGADELVLRRVHVVDADKMVKPCRCGPDGCADSVACPKAAR